MELGITISEDGKHYKLTYNNDPRYMVTVGKTPSDNRAGNNNAALINKIMMQDYGDSYVRQLQKSVDDTKNSRQLEERFMMIEELLQEEFQAGKAEGIAEGEAA